MHKQKKIIHRATDRLRFHLERLVLRGLRYRLLLAAIIVLVVALAAGELAHILVPDLTDSAGAIWWAFLRLTDPGYLGDDQGFAQRFISTIVTVLGYVLFLGLLIAILTQWLNRFIARLESGIAPVTISNHLLLLGWTHRTPIIAHELLRTGNRAKRFLQKRGARELRIVILAENVNEALLRKLQEQIGRHWNDRQVMLRSGSPLNIEHLERVSFLDAAVLILPGADFAEQSPGVVDADTIKTLLSVSKHAGAYGSHCPLAVAGLYDASRSSIARAAYNGDTEIVAADEIISRLMAQSVRQKGLCDVFSELLYPHVGNKLYVRSLAALTGAQFSDLRNRFARAILLGTVRSGDFRPVLNPDPATTIRKEDLLVFIARSYEDCAPGPTGPEAGSLEIMVPPHSAQEDRRRILILGWSRKVPSLLHQLERHGGEFFRVDVVGLKSKEVREQLLADHGLSPTGNSVRHIEANFLVPSVIEGLKPESFDDILIVARESLADEEHADAASVSTYLTLHSLLPTDGSGPHVLVELLDEENFFLFDDRLADIIVSPMIISYVLSQIALRRELAAVFSELCRPRGTEITLKPATGFMPKSGPVSFSDIQIAAAERGLIALGLRRGSGADNRLELNPDRNAKWKLAPEDRVVVLATFEQ